MRLLICLMNSVLTFWCPVINFNILYFIENFARYFFRLLDINVGIKFVDESLEITFVSDDAVVRCIIFGMTELDITKGLKAKCIICHCCLLKWASSKFHSHDPPPWECWLRSVSSHHSLSYTPRSFSVCFHSSLSLLESELERSHTRPPCTTPHNPADTCLKWSWCLMDLPITLAVISHLWLPHAWLTTV